MLSSSRAFGRPFGAGLRSVCLAAASITLVSLVSCGGSSSASATKDGGPGGSVDSGAIDGASSSPDASFDASGHGALEAGATCGAGLASSSTCGFTAAFSGATTAADGSLTVTLANTHAAACSPNGDGTTQQIQLRFPPSTALGTFDVIATPDGGGPPTGKVTVSYDFFLSAGGGGGGGKSSADGGTVTLTAVGLQSAAGSFRVTFASTGCASGPSTITGTFAATACACP